MFLHRHSHLLSCFIQLQRVQFFYHGLGFLTDRFLALLTVGIWSRGTLHPRLPVYQGFVANDEFHAVQVAVAQPVEEIEAAGLPFFYAFGCTKNLVVAVLIDCNRCQNGYIFKFIALVAVQVDSIHVDIWISPPCSGWFHKSSMWTYFFLFSSLMVEGDTLLPHRASVISSTCRIDTAGLRDNLMSTSSKQLSEQQYRSILPVSKETLLSFGILRVISLEVVIRLRL